MCTLTIVPQPQGIVVTMNRDEYRDRSEAGLKRGECNGVEYACPVDGRAGGSWIGVNAQGLLVALLNRYQAPTVEDARSRGEIIPTLLQCPDRRSAIHALQTLDPEPYNPFDCVLVADGRCYQASWDRESYHFQACDINAGLLMTSSSERLAAVRQYRQQAFTAWQQGEATLAGLGALHLCQPAAMAGSAVLMSRPLTHTKSLVQIALTVDRASLRYYNQQSLKANVTLDELQPSDQHDLPIMASSVVV